MPPPPLHTLAIAWVYFKLEGRMDSLALALSSSIIDLEPLFVLVLGLQQSFHGFWHSYFGVLLLSILLTLGVYLIELRASGVIARGYKILRIDSARARYPLKLVFFTSVIGGFSHVFFDMFTHKSFPYVLYPWVISSNPAWTGFGTAMVVEALVVSLSAYSIWLWMKLLLKNRAKEQELNKS